MYKTCKEKKLSLVLPILADESLISVIQKYHTRLSDSSQVTWQGCVSNKKTMSMFLIPS